MSLYYYQSNKGFERWQHTNITTNSCRICFLNLIWHGTSHQGMIAVHTTFQETWFSTGWLLSRMNRDYTYLRLLKHVSPRISCSGRSKSAKNFSASLTGTKSVQCDEWLISKKNNFIRTSWLWTVKDIPNNRNYILPNYKNHWKIKTILHILFILKTLCMYNNQI